MYKAIGEILISFTDTSPTGLYNEKASFPPLPYVQRKRLHETWRQPWKLFGAFFPVKLVWFSFGTHCGGRCCIIWWRYIYVLSDTSDPDKRWRSANQALCDVFALGFKSHTSYSWKFCSCQPFELHDVMGKWNCGTSFMCHKSHNVRSSSIALVVGFSLCENFDNHWYQNFVYLLFERKRFIFKGCNKGCNMMFLVINPLRTRGAYMRH